ncbi:MAG TPA: DUF1622 domain-containing protein [Burkholderiaceae bacterium]|nr:DUF1622 domain-containing protein [Burkholderiaceae bacterium]
MRELLVQVTEQSVILIDAIALIVILWGTLQAVASVVHGVITTPTAHTRHEVWLGYARWLVAGLTLQLAADIIETSITTDWVAIARVAAIAVIRTFLNFFLERDMQETREREKEIHKLEAKA